MPPPPVYRSRSHLLSLTADGGNFGVCDLTAAFAYAWFTAPAARHPSYVRHYFLDAIGYTLISHRYLAPVHGACISRDGRGILLCGAAGAGKSTLAYACARKGWAFISDDSSFMVRNLNDRTIIGNPYKMRFRPSATRLFPELAGRVAVFAPNGKPTIEVPTSELEFVQTARVATIECIVFLNRRAGAAPTLVQFSRETAFQELEQVVFFGEDSVRELQRAALHRLLDGGLYEFIYDNLEAAVECLERLAERGGPV